MTTLVRYVRIPKFCELCGEYTPKAVQEKIRTGAWIEGCEYRRAPDGHILVDVEGFQRWVEGRRRAA